MQSPKGGKLEFGDLTMNWAVRGLRSRLTKGRNFLREQRFDYGSMDIGQPEVAPLVAVC
jgi:hypothetical protein